MRQECALRSSHRGAASRLRSLKLRKTRYHLQLMRRMTPSPPYELAYPMTQKVHRARQQPMWVPPPRPCRPHHTGRLRPESQESASKAKTLCVCVCVCVCELNITLNALSLSVKHKHMGVLHIFTHTYTHMHDAWIHGRACAYASAQQALKACMQCMHQNKKKAL